MGNNGNHPHNVNKRCFITGNQVSFVGTMSDLNNPDINGVNTHIGVISLQAIPVYREALDRVFHENIGRTQTAKSARKAVLAILQENQL